MHLDRVCDNQPTRTLLVELGFAGAIARQGVPAPILAGTRWVVERAHACMNRFGKLRRCTEKVKAVVDFYLLLGAGLVVVRQLIHRARLHYRWPGRLITRRLKLRLLPVTLSVARRDLREPLDYRHATIHEVALENTPIPRRP